MKKLLLNPFEKYDGLPLFGFGIATTILGSFIASFFNARFDGAMDMHLGSVDGSTSFLQTLKDNAINVASLTLMLFATALWINRKTRFVDIINTVMVARIAIYIMPLFNLFGYLNRVTQRIMESVNTETPDISKLLPTDIIYTLAFTLVTLALFIWFIALLYNGFKTASNLKTTLQKVIFALAIIAAEILSTYLIRTLNY